MPSVCVKWGKEKLDVDANLEESPLTFKAQLFALTGVAPERQKVMIKGKTLGDENWTGITLPEGAMIMMMGSAGAVPKPPSQQELAAANGDGAKGGEKKALPLPVGLKNLGNTCYLNSVVQSFKTIPELCSGLSAYQPTASQTSSGRLTAAVKNTFEQLSQPGRQSDNAVIPLMMVQSLHTVLPQFASRSSQGGGWQQQDANECFSELQRIMLDATGKVKCGSGEVDVKELFRGRYKVSQKCVESEDEPEQITNEDFFQLSCFLSQEVKYIQTGIKEKLTEEIEKNSQALGRNAKWQRKAQISRLPAYTSVQMVRFFYKENTNTNAKILKDVKFPMTLDLCDICTPELQAKLKPARLAFKDMEDILVERLRVEKMGGPDAAAKKDDGEVLPYSFEEDPGSNNSGFYELKAVITHKGRSSDSGHYVAWVRLGGEQWAMCDDDEVHPVTQEQVLKLSGGGDWHCAYVLVYGPRQLRKLEAPAAEQPVVEEMQQ